MLYFDNAATTQVTPEIAELVLKYMVNLYGNPSSLHHMGLEAEKALKNSRGLIAKHLNCQPDQLVFTSGGTEGNNTVIRGVCENRNKKGHLITTAVEHASVLSNFELLASKGWDITYLAVDQAGRVSPESVISALREDTLLVSIMYVNNEIGTIQPIHEIGLALKMADYKGYFHTDATQAIGKVPLSLRNLPVDFLTLSAHKCHGPKGVGLIYKRTNGGLSPMIVGGGQENQMRSGTENLPGIVGMAKAIAMACDSMVKNDRHILAHKTAVVLGLKPLGDAAIIFSPTEPLSVPHILSLGFKGIKSEVLLHALEQHDICVSSGSACSTHKKETVSHVIKAIQAPIAYRDGVIRISFSKLTTSDEVSALIKAICTLVPSLLSAHQRRN